MTTILVADDDASIRQTLALFLEGKGYRVLVAEDGEEAVALARAEEPDLILLDIRMPRLDGLAALRALKEEVRAPVIMITALDDMESTIRSLQLGAYEFLTKPLDITKLEITLRRALEAQATRQRAQWGARREQEQRQVQLARLVGHSPAMIEIFKRIGLASTSRAPVLITGEAGTGKELVAKAIHDHSPEREEPFLATSCAAASARQLEGALFGRALSEGEEPAGPGLLEQAGCGTVLLDEVSEMPLEVQARLARALEEGAIRRQGSQRSARLAVRVMASSYRDLEALVGDGLFREDLFYLLSVIRIHLPPLRERREDIPPLVSAIVGKLNGELHRALSGISPEALAVLQAYDWPGNVRELENVLARSMALTREEMLGAEDLALAPLTHRGEIRGARAAAEEWDRLAGDCLPALDEMEAWLVRRMLEATRWNKKEAAARLGISRPTLDRKIRLYGLK